MDEAKEEERKEKRLRSFLSGWEACANPDTQDWFLCQTIDSPLPPPTKAVKTRGRTSQHKVSLRERVWWDVFAWFGDAGS